ncbi:MAG TPA: hypothetical protein VFM79_13310 [Pelobium sp.]|nr:hypothetical protein [Pelobium sp.]
MGILEDKIALAKRILETDDSSLLQQVKDFFAVRETDFWDELPESVKEAIKKGQQEANEGLLTPHEEVMKKYQKYL